jgi:EAL domain-containing protein (putative c-di-GMP-specific phosphodiesterase class I)
LIKLHTPAEVNHDLVHTAGASFGIAEILEGLENDEFEPFFQPKVELATGRVKGAEALARWRHPRKGVVPPYAFIGPLEANQMIDAFTGMMLRKAATFCSQWRSASGLDVTVSVNLSAKSLVDVHLAEWVTQRVRDANLDPQHMVLEVTESAATTEVGAALENLSRLRMKGFGLSIDDYGTGYSSIQRLSRGAFTEIKIDRSFVANATTQDAARIILESSLDMARKLKITSVAEGVETQKDWELLRELGCELAQGYLIAKPLQASEFLGWFRDAPRF